MGWQVNYDGDWKRDVGYGVPATCDHPGCGERIDRGLSYVCGGEPYGGDEGCGLFFCEKHRGYRWAADGNTALSEHRLCERCLEGAEPFEPTPDVPEWTHHKLTDPSWQQWRDENPEQVARLRSEPDGAIGGVCLWIPRPRAITTLVIIAVTTLLVLGACPIAAFVAGRAY